MYDFIKTTSLTGGGTQTREAVQQNPYEEIVNVPRTISSRVLKYYSDVIIDPTYTNMYYFAKSWMQTPTDENTANSDFRQFNLIDANTNQIIPFFEWVYSSTYNFNPGQLFYRVVTNEAQQLIGLAIPENTPLAADKLQETINTQGADASVIIFTETLTCNFNNTVEEQLANPLTNCIIEPKESNTVIHKINVVLNTINIDGTSSFGLAKIEGTNGYTIPYVKSLTINSDESSKLQPFDYQYDYETVIPKQDCVCWIVLLFNPGNYSYGKLGDLTAYNIYDFRPRDPSKPVTDNAMHFIFNGNNYTFNTDLNFDDYVIGLLLFTDVDGDPTMYNYDKYFETTESEEAATVLSARSTPEPNGVYIKDYLTKDKSERVYNYIPGILIKWGDVE